MKHSKEEVKAFIGKLKRSYAKGLLTTKQIADLESLPGWTWDDSDAEESRNQQIDFLIDQKQEEGRLTGSDTDLGLIG